LAIVLSGLACASAAAAPLQYRFDLVAETGTAYTRLGAPAVNDLGVVAFWGGGNTSAQARVYYGTPGLVQAIAPPPGLLVGDLDHSATINDRNQVAFVARTGIGSQGVYVATPGAPLVTIFPPGTYQNTVLRPAAINNNGLVAAAITGGVTEQLVVGDGSAPPRVIYGYSGSGALYAPHINSAGQVVISDHITITNTDRLFFDDRIIVDSNDPFVDPDFPGVPNTRLRPGLDSDVKATVPSYLAPPCPASAASARSTPGRTGSSRRYPGRAGS
jgi:hypothetical protein